VNFQGRNFGVKTKKWGHGYQFSRRTRRLWVLRLERKRMESKCEIWWKNPPEEGKSDFNSVVAYSLAKYTCTYLIHN